MSENDTLCRPLASLYNIMLKEVLDKLSAAPDPHHNILTRTDFEVTATSRFTDVGLQIAPIVAGRPSQALYQLDIYHDGGKRWVFLVDQSVGETPITKVRVLKLNVGFQDANRLISGFPEDRAKDLIDQSANLKEEFTASYDHYGLHNYILRKWPDLDSVLNTFSRNLSIHKPSFAPVISSMTTTRIFLFSGMVVFIADEHTDARFPTHAESFVVAYTLNHDGPSDICYIHMAPNTTDASN